MGSDRSELLFPMSRSAEAAPTVLGSMQVLYDQGANAAITPGDVIAGFDEIGIRGNYVRGFAQ